MYRIGFYSILLMLALASLLLTGCGGSGSATSSSGGSTTGNGSTANTGGSASASNTDTTPISPHEFVYATDLAGNGVLQYQVSQAGALIPLSPKEISAGTSPTALVSDPKSQFLYVSNTADGTISQYQIGTNGALNPLTPPTVSAGSFVPNMANKITLKGPFRLAIDSSGKFLFAENSNDNNLREYAINANGTLTFLNVAPGVNAISSLTSNPQKEALYLTSDANTFLQFKINPNGSLTALAPPSLPTQPDQIAVAPNGKYAYLAFTGAIVPAQYGVNADGSLTLIRSGSGTTGAKTSFLYVDPLSRYVYSSFLNGASGGELQQFRIQSDGSLTAITPASVSVGLAAPILTFDASGKYAYVASILGGVLLQFQISSNGALVDQSTPTVGAGALPLEVTSAQRATWAHTAYPGYRPMITLSR